MKREILERIKALGGNIDKISGSSLAEDLLSTSFDTVLYRKPRDTPWQTAQETEPINGIDDFLEQQEALLKIDKQAIYQKVIEKYYCLTTEGYGQFFWQPSLFTPFKKDTVDFDEWNLDFTSESTDLTEVLKLTNDKNPDFIKLFYCYGYPDHYYICLSDPNPENPTLFGTDHEVYFREISNEGSLEDFLNSFMTKNELLEILRNQIEK